MAGSLNKVSLLGNLGRDPEIRSMQNGRRVASFSIATSESWKDKQTGEKQERTEWHRIAIFSEGLVSVVERYLKKGSKVYIEGALQTRKWTDSSSGQEKYTTEVVVQGFGGKFIMLDSRGGGGAGGGGSGGGGYGGGAGGGAGGDDGGGYGGGYEDGGQGQQGQYDGGGDSSGGGGQARQQGGQAGAGAGAGSQAGGVGVGSDDALDDDIPF